MLKRPDERVSQCLLRLNGPEFDALRAWLVECELDTMRLGSKAADEVAVRWMQGQAQQLAELLKAIETSRTT